MKFIQLYDSLLKYKPNLASDKPSSLTNKFASNIENKSFYLNPITKFRVNDWWSLARVWQHWLRAVKQQNKRKKSTHKKTNQILELELAQSSAAFQTKTKKRAKAVQEWRSFQRMKWLLKNQPN